MKKAIWLLIFCGTLGTMLAGQTINVYSPKTGDYWVAPDKYTIKWKATGSMDSFVTIRLRNSSGLVQVLADKTENDGSFDCPFSNPVPAPGKYYIRVRTLSDGVTGDSGEFSFGPPQEFAIASPMGGEKWTIGPTHSISWTAKNITGKISISLHQYIKESNGTKYLGTIAENIDSSAGSYSWPAGKYGSPSQKALPGDYCVSIQLGRSLQFKRFSKPFSLVGNVLIPGKR